MMTQNSSISAMLFNPRIMDIPQRSSSKGIDKGDDTFMKMLNERMQTKQVTGAKNRLVEKSEPLARSNQPVTDYKKDEVKDSGSKTAEVKGKGIKETSGTEASDEVTITDEPKDNTKETVMALESMITLLEELLAKLDVKTVAEAPTEPMKSETVTELMPGVSENMSPIELLKALLEGNAEKLKSLMAQTSESELPEELKGFVEKLQTLLEKMSGTEGIKPEMMDLTLGAVSSEPDREKLINQLKAQVSDVIEKLKVRVSEIKTKPDQGLAAEQVQIPVESLMESPRTNSESEADASKQEAESESKVEKKVSEPKEKPIHTTKTQENVKSGAQAENKTTGDFAIPSEQKGPEAVNAKPERSPFPLSEKPLAQTVSNQVIMKVKLMAGENKQEMEMQLKPESLGKLSLKIIHERGEILAKITAENEQVKGILESNMQLLKDALEKSGLSVQSLSVSVGNGNDRNPSRQDLNENVRSHVRGLSETLKSSSAAENLNSRVKIRDYYGQTSQINLTA